MTLCSDADEARQQLIAGIIAAFEEYKDSEMLDDANRLDELIRIGLDELSSLEVSNQCLSNDVDFHREEIRNLERKIVPINLFRNHPDPYGLHGLSPNPFLQ